MAKLSSVSPKTRSLLLLALLVSSPILLNACTTSPQSYLVARGPVAEKVLNLHVLIFWLSLAVFVGVQGLLIYTLLRYRRRRGEAAVVPAQTHGNTRLEIFWSVVPVLIVLVLAVPTVQQIGEFTTLPTTPDTLKVRVVAHQWWWEFHYPDLGVTTADELHIPVGQPISFDLESADVIHSFWVPYLSGTLDTIPGRVNKMWFQADEPGNYWGQCKEFCGASHALMGLRVIAESPQDFNAWVQAMRTPAATPPSGPAARGAEIFGAVSPANPAATTPATGTCEACHTIQGTEAQGKVGPDLTLFGRRTTLAAGVLPNTPEHLRNWLDDPEAIKPGSKMPDYDLTPEELDALVAYLQSLQ
jgi:cytochrome c oxidase subunit II